MSWDGDVKHLLGLDRSLSLALNPFGRAVQRELVTAQQVGSPELVAAASWALCGGRLHEASLDPAKNAALSALDAIEPHVGTGDDPIRSRWGAAVAFSRLQNIEMWTWSMWLAVLPPRLDIIFQPAPVRTS